VIHRLSHQPAPAPEAERAARKSLSKPPAARCTSRYAKPTSTALLISRLHSRFSPNWNAQPHRTTCNHREESTPRLQRLFSPSSLARNHAPGLTTSTQARPGSAPYPRTASIDKHYSSLTSDFVARPSLSTSPIKPTPWCTRIRTRIRWRATRAWLATASRLSLKC
jgi:hypothetical protein